ncbi:hypothetical protein B0H21DRAFT_54758 [Amylocystis lapponica]|nr:hypothetical protein B0H21DRAFT_54758 [Amylocystis lapponica]
MTKSSAQTSGNTPICQPDSVQLRCLAIDEILRPIMEDVLDNGRGRGSVGSLAVTCRCFKELALSILWHKLDSFVPLLRLLPSHAWHQVRDGHGSKVLHLRTVDKLNLDLDPSRLAQYAQLVREFEWTSNEDASTDLLHRFFANRTGQDFLFPNMRSILWNETREAIFPYVLSVISPHTRTLSIRDSPTDHSLVARVLSEVALCCTKLQDIEILYLAQHPDASNALVQLLSNNSANLSRLASMSLIMPKGMLALALMPRLVDVSIWMNCAPLNSPLLDSSTPLQFPVLKYLEFHIDSLDAGSLSVFSALEAPRLVTFHMTISHQPTVDVLREHLDVFACAPCRSALRIFTLQCALPKDPWGGVFGNLQLESEQGLPMHTVTAETLQPLLRLSLLTHLVVKTPWPALDITFLRKCAQTFRSIEEFVLLPAGPASSSTSPYVPLDALVEFAEHCPELNNLGLRVDASRPPSDPVKFYSQSLLRILHVSDAPIAEPEVIAALLAQLFPELEQISYWPTETQGEELERDPFHDLQERTYAPAWAIVQEMVSK